MHHTLYISRRLPALAALAILALAAYATPAVWADSTSTNHPFDGVVCYSKTRTDPPTRLFIAAVDLTNPNLRLRVAPGGPDPDGTGPWQTTLMAPTRIAAREGFALVVNGDFFEARGLKDAEGSKSGYRAEIWAAVKGPAVTDGRNWAVGTNERPCLIVHRDGKVAIEG